MHISTVTATGLVRVVNANVVCRGPGGAARQAAALRQEGVTVAAGAMGDYSVDFGLYGWFPIQLPSEGSERSGPE